MNAKTLERGAHVMGAEVKLPRFLSKKPEPDRLIVIKALNFQTQGEGVNAVRRITCEKSLHHVACTTANTKIGFAAVDRIEDKHLLVRVAKEAGHSGIAAYAAKSVLGGSDKTLDALVMSKHEVVQCMVAGEMKKRIDGAKNWPPAKQDRAETLQSGGIRYF